MPTCLAFWILLVALDFRDCCCPGSLPIGWNGLLQLLPRWVSSSKQYRDPCCGLLREKVLERLFFCAFIEVGSQVVEAGIVNLVEEENPNRS